MLYWGGEFNLMSDYYCWNIAAFNIQQHLLKDNQPEPV